MFHFGKSMDTAEQLLHRHLQYQYDAEMRLIEALPVYADACSSEQLSEFLRQHLSECHRQAGRIADIFHRIGKVPERETSAGMKGILVDIDSVTSTYGDPGIRDAALVMAVQQAEHHEIAGFANLRLLSRAVGREDAAVIFTQCLEEVTTANERLTELVTPVITVPSLGE